MRAAGSTSARCTTEEVSRLVAMAGLALAAAGSGACTDSQCSGTPTSFQVFQSGAPTSAIPLCTDSTSGSGPPRLYVYPPQPPPLQIDGATGYPFPGAPSLSHAALEQCASICSTDTYAIPCCLSQWEPQTVVCTPACVP